MAPSHPQELGGHAQKETILLYIRIAGAILQVAHRIKHQSSH
jgi:hypothetical protein